MDPSLPDESVGGTATAEAQPKPSDRPVQLPESAAPPVGAPQAEAPAPAAAAAAAAPHPPTGSRSNDPATLYWSLYRDVFERGRPPYCVVLNSGKELDIYLPLFGPPAAACARHLLDVAFRGTADVLALAPPQPSDGGLAALIKAIAAATSTATAATAASPAPAVAAASAPQDTASPAQSDPSGNSSSSTAIVSEQTTPAAPAPAPSRPLARAGVYVITVRGRYGAPLRVGHVHPQILAQAIAACTAARILWLDRRPAADLSGAAVQQLLDIQLTLPLMPSGPLLPEPLTPHAATATATAASTSVDATGAGVEASAVPLSSSASTPTSASSTYISESAMRFLAKVARPDFICNLIVPPNAPAVPAGYAPDPDPAVVIADAAPPVMLQDASASSSSTTSADHDTSAALAQPVPPGSVLPPVPNALRPAVGAVQFVLGRRNWLAGTVPFVRPPDTMPPEALSGLVALHRVLSARNAAISDRPAAAVPAAARSSTVATIAAVAAVAASALGVPPPGAGGSIVTPSATAVLANGRAVGPDPRRAAPTASFARPTGPSLPFQWGFGGVPRLRGSIPTHVAGPSASASETAPARWNALQPGPVQQASESQAARPLTAVPASLGGSNVPVTLPVVPIVAAPASLTITPLSEASEMPTLPPLHPDLPPRVQWGSYCQVLRSREADDSQWVCDVCMRDDSYPGNAILICERCYVCVHQCCYGMRVVPKDDFLCQACQEELATSTDALVAAQNAASQPADSMPSSTNSASALGDHASSGALSNPSHGPRPPAVSAPRCLLCPNRGGAMRKLSDSLLPGVGPTQVGGPSWVHLACAVWLRSIVIRNDRSMDGIAGRSQLASRHFCLITPEEAVTEAETLQNRKGSLTVCRVCHGSTGILRFCDAAHCQQAFHVSCGQRAGFVFRATPDEDPVSNGTVALGAPAPKPVTQWPSLEAFCDMEHSMDARVDVPKSLTNLRAVQVIQSLGLYPKEVPAMGTSGEVEEILASSHDPERLRLLWSQRLSREDDYWLDVSDSTLRPFPESWPRPLVHRAIAECKALFIAREELTDGAGRDLRVSRFIHDFEIFHCAYGAVDLATLLDTTDGIRVPMEDTGQEEDCDLYTLYRAVRAETVACGLDSRSYTALLRVLDKTIWLRVFQRVFGQRPMSDGAFFRLLAIYRNLLYPFERYFELVGGWRSFVSPLFRLIIQCSPRMQRGFLVGLTDAEVAASIPEGVAHMGALWPRSSGKLLLRKLVRRDGSVVASLLGVHSVSGDGSLLLDLYTSVREGHPILDAAADPLWVTTRQGQALVRIMQELMADSHDMAGAELLHELSNHAMRIAGADSITRQPTNVRIFSQLQDQDDSAVPMVDGKRPPRVPQSRAGRRRAEDRDDDDDGKLGSDTVSVTTHVTLHLVGTGADHSGERQRPYRAVYASQVDAATLGLGSKFAGYKESRASASRSSKRGRDSDEALRRPSRRAGSGGHDDEILVHDYDDPDGYDDDGDNDDEDGDHDDGDDGVGSNSKRHRSSTATLRGVYAVKQRHVGPAPPSVHAVQSHTPPKRSMGPMTAGTTAEEQHRAIAALHKAFGPGSPDVPPPSVSSATPPTPTPTPMLTPGEASGARIFGGGAVLGEWVVFSFSSRPTAAEIEARLQRTAAALRHDRDTASPSSSRPRSRAVHPAAEGGGE